MLLPFFLLALAALGFLICRLLSATKHRRAKSLTVIATGGILVICFLDHVTGSVLGYLWAKQGLEEISIPVRADFPVWHFTNVQIEKREYSYGRLPITDPLYGIDLYFEEMIDRGYSRIEVISAYDPSKKYVLSVIADADFPACQLYFNLPKTPSDTASKIDFRLERFTRDKLLRAIRTLLNGESARCISVEPAAVESGNVLEKYEAKVFEILGVQIQYRATRKLIDTASNRILAERREVWSDGGWFVRYVLANPEVGTSGRGYRYGGATAPLTIPVTQQAVVHY